MRSLNRCCEACVDKHSGGAATGDAVGSRTGSELASISGGHSLPAQCVHASASARCGARDETEYTGDLELDAPRDFSCVR